jgi:hypothetical protein
MAATIVPAASSPATFKVAHYPSRRGVRVVCRRSPHGREPARRSRVRRRDLAGRAGPRRRPRGSIARAAPRRASASSPACVSAGAARASETRRRIFVISARADLCARAARLAEKPSRVILAMIVSYRDKRTERFAGGAPVKEFSGFARQAELQRIEWKSRRALPTSRACEAIVWRRSKEIVWDNFRSRSTSNGEFAFLGLTHRRDR